MRQLKGERLEAELMRLDAMRQYEKQYGDCLISAGSTRRAGDRWRGRWRPEQ